MLVAFVVSTVKRSIEGFHVFTVARAVDIGWTGFLKAWCCPGATALTKDRRSASLPIPSPERVNVEGHSSSAPDLATSSSATEPLLYPKVPYIPVPSHITQMRQLGKLPTDQSGL